MNAFDVLVAGAGPAGSVAARDLALRGARVALIDGTFPREKPCGGGVTGRALRLAVGVPRTAGQSLETIRFESDARSATVALPASDYLEVFSREQFDAALLGEAVAAGAVHVPSRLRAFSRDESRWTARLDTGDTLTGSWLLGADGAGGIVRKQVFRPFERRQLSVAAGSYVDGVQIHEIVIGFVDRPRGYLWSFPRPGHLAVGTCAQADEATTARMHAITDAWLDGYGPAAGKPRRRYAWPIPSLGAGDLDAERPAGTGWMLLGDAAGLVDPITREGIFFAIRSGMLAAQALAQPDSASVYAMSIRDEIHEELRRAARLKAGFFRPRFTSLLVDALNESEAIRGVMIDLVAGRQPYRGLKRRLIRTLELRLMARLLTARDSRRARGRWRRSE